MIRPKIGLLALSLELYESLAPGLRQNRDAWVRKAVIPALEKQAQVLFGGGVFTREGVDAQVASFEAAGVDAICVLLLTYAPSQIALPALARTRLPILIWNTQELAGVDNAYGDAELTNNHGVHGTQDLANVLVRSGVRFQYVTSHLGDSGGVKGLGDFAVAAAAVGRLRRARLGLLGYPFPGMGDFALDTTYLAGSLGCQWSQLSVEEYILRAQAADTAAVATLVQEYRRLYDVAADVTQGDLASTARVEIALRGMVADNRVDGFTYQFMAFGQDERTPTVPFVAASRMMADGIGFGGEGDLIGAAGTCLLHWLQAPASFSEIFTIDFAGNSVFMSHMGEANVAMARRGQKVPLVARSSPITRTRDRQLALVTNLQPGPATLSALTQGPGNRWRLICSSMQIVDFGPLPLASPHFKLAPRGDVREFLTAYAKAAGPHHNAVCFGDARARLRLAAELLDADYIEI